MQRSWLLLAVCACLLLQTQMRAEALRVDVNPDNDRRDVLTQRVRRSAEHGSGLCKIPLQEVRFSQHDPDTELVFLGQRRGRPQQGSQEFDGRGSLSALERRPCPDDNGLKRGVGHGASIQLAT